MGLGPADVTRITDIFKALCRLSINEDDGIKFVSDSVKAIPIREEQSYDGIRVTLMGMLHNARIPLQVDIGFGDIITPIPDRIEFPTLLGTPPPQLLAYPKYTMVAEKIEAIVRLGMANSRMKDFYDIWLMCGLFDFDGSILCNAIKNTFKRRSTLLPVGVPIALTDEFRKDAGKQTQWLAFIRKLKPINIARDFDAVTDKIKDFLMPVMQAARSENHFDKHWPIDGPWL